MELSRVLTCHLPAFDLISGATGLTAVSLGVLVFLTLTELTLGLKLLKSITEIP